MREINLIVVHCSDSKASMNVDAAVIDGWHKARGWKGIGYHLVILRDGSLERGRPLEEIGAHVYGHNKASIGICMVGGLSESNQPENNFTQPQFSTLSTLLHSLTSFLPGAVVLGHRDLSPDVDGDGVIEQWEWMKDCPCFDVKPWWAEELAKKPLA